MRRVHNIEDNYQLVFDAPLTSDLQDKVSGVIGTTNLTSGGTIDAVDGMSGAVMARGKYFLMFDMRNKLLQTIFSTSKGFVTEYEQYYQSGNGVCRNMFFTKSANTNISYSVMYSFFSTAQGLKTNTWQKITQVSRFNWESKSTLTRYLDDNETPYEHREDLSWRKSDFEQCNYLILVPSIANTTAYFTGKVRNFKIWVER